MFARRFDGFQFFQIRFVLVFVLGVGQVVLTRGRLNALTLESTTSSPSPDRPAHDSARTGAATPKWERGKLWEARRGAIGSEQTVTCLRGRARRHALLIRSGNGNFSASAHAGCDFLWVRDAQIFAE